MSRRSIGLILLGVLGIALLFGGWLGRLAIGHWWSALNVPMQGSLIGAAATIVAAMLAATVAVLAIGHQVRLNEATRLKVEIYKSTLVLCEEAENAAVDLNVYLHGIITEMKYARTIATSASRSNDQWEAMARQGNELNAGLGRAAPKIVTAVEQWMVVDPRIDIFRSAFGSAMHDLREAFFGDLFPAIMWNRDFGRAANAADKVSPDRLALLQTKAENCAEAVQELLSYITDFRIAMQNLLVSKLFGHFSPERETLTGKVIRISDHKELRRHFSVETAWGKSNARALEAAKRAIAEET